MSLPRGTVVGPARIKSRVVVLRLESRLVCVLVGIALAQLFLVPGCSWFAWFVSSLVHELGHSVAGIACGYPAFPAVRLDGHAATMVNDERSPALTVLAIAAFAYGAWHFRESRLRCALFALATLLAPVLGFTKLRDPFFLAAGHLSELAFAGVFLCRALSNVSDPDGERTEIARVLYAVGGWYLLAKNVALFVGLRTDVEVVTEYYSNGSFGLQNDLVRLAADVFDVPLATVAGWMLAPAVLAPAIALAVAWRLRQDEHAESSGTTGW